MYSTIYRRQKHLDIAISYQKSNAGLHLLVDSIGLKFLGEGEWKCKKYQPECRRQWRKLHIGIDAETMQIRAVQLTTNNVSDSQVLGDLLDQIPPGRSLVETKMHCINLAKQCFSGDKLSARSFDSQVNEIHARIAVLNKLTELARPHIQVVT